jgi:hypothetical protein
MIQARQAPTNHDLHAVSSAMRPLRGPLLAHVSAEIAWARMIRDGLQFLVLVEAGAGRMVGVVTRQSLKSGPCCARHGSSCSVVNHRAADGAFCFADEDLHGVLEAESALSKEYPFPPQRSAPLIVVDRALRPLGYIPSAAAQLAWGRQSAA